MSQRNSKEDNSKTISLEVDSPEALNVVQLLMATLSDEDSIESVKFKVEVEGGFSSLGDKAASILESHRDSQNSTSDLDAITEDKRQSTDTDEIEESKVHPESGYKEKDSTVEDHVNSSSSDEKDANTDVDIEREENPYSQQAQEDIEKARESYEDEGGDNINNVLEEAGLDPLEEDDIKKPSESDDEDEDIEPIYDDYFSLGTRLYQISSTLFHADEPLTARNIKEKVEDTEWDVSIKTLWTYMREISDMDIVGKKENESTDSKYVYYITDKGKEVMIAAEDQAEKEGYETYESLFDGSSSDAEEIESDDNSYVCDYCGEGFDSQDSLNGHLAWCDGYSSDESEEDSSSELTENEEQSSDEDDEAEETEEDETDLRPYDYDIKVKNASFKVASTLYNLAKPASKTTIYEHLEDSEWEISKSMIEKTLSDMVEYDFVGREKRRGQSGVPYEYELTNISKKLVRDKIKEAEERDELTYIKVIEGK